MTYYGRKGNAKTPNNMYCAEYNMDHIVLLIFGQNCEKKISNPSLCDLSDCGVQIVTDVFCCLPICLKEGLIFWTNSTAVAIPFGGHAHPSYND